MRGGLQRIRHADALFLVKVAHAEVGKADFGSGNAPLRTSERISVTQFSDLGLAENVLRALTTEGYTVPTPIQAQAIPPLLEGRDLLGIAQSGTG